MEVYPTGTEVKLCSGVKATILEICIMGTNVRYVVSFWLEKQRYVETVDSFEIVYYWSEPIKIGFKQP